MERGAKGQILEIDELQRQFSGVQDLVDQKYRNLEDSYRELQSLFDSRPSRNEDLEIISQLQKNCNEKESQLRKAFEDKKFYKLELLNREENYNKLFGAKPVIGFYNPLEDKMPAKEFNATFQTKENIGTAPGKRRKYSNL